MENGKQYVDIVFTKHQIIESIVKETDDSSADEKEEEQEKSTKSSPKMKRSPSQKSQSFQKKSVSSVKKTKELGLQLQQVYFLNITSCFGCC
jgi:hypothetical protein